MREVGGTGTAVLEQLRTGAKRADAKPVGAPRHSESWTPVSALEFVGYESCRMTLAEYENYPEDPEDGRKIEFFDSAAGLAWMVEDSPNLPHEDPVRRLVALVQEIAITRGSPIRCRGAGSLQLRDADSRRMRALHPDEMVFLHPERSHTADPEFLAAGKDSYPEVVLEVDHTCDIRRGKLKLYEEWGFPELWVEVPNVYSRSRPRRLQAELRIYLLEGERYAMAAESRAFPGWRAEEIHRALNEVVISEETSAVLSRVGRALGEREGTGPEDHPLLASLGRRRQAAGREAGRVEGRIEGRAGMVRAILASRGIEIAADFPPAGYRAALSAASDAATLSAAASASSEADFLNRLG